MLIMADGLFLLSLAYSLFVGYYTPYTHELGLAQMSDTWNEERHNVEADIGIVVAVVVAVVVVLVVVTVVVVFCYLFCQIDSIS